MIETILTASGLPYRKGRFLNPPAKTYAVYFDDLEVDGPDPVGISMPRIVRHEPMIELYEPALDPDAEAALEAQLNARGLPWTKEYQGWLQNLQRHMVVYNLHYLEKVRI